MISAVVLTKNEEKNLNECLKSLNWCKEIIVIDDYSSDKTRIIGKQSGAIVFRHHLNNDFASQRNFALEKAHEEWVIFIDADERVSPNLQKEILLVLKQNMNGFFVKRKDFFGGRWLNFGETSRVKLLRLGRKNSGCWKRSVHEYWDVGGKVGFLKNPLLHYPHPNLDQFITEVNFFSSLHAQALSKEGKRASPFNLIFKPLGKFLLNYFLLLGFLDGVPGLVMALMMSLHSFLAWSKLYLKWKR